MKRTNCKTCGDGMMTKYDPMKKPKVAREVTEVEWEPTRSCHISIYLTCADGHTNGYYCRIEDKK